MVILLGEGFAPGTQRGAAQLQFALTTPASRRASVGLTPAILALETPRKTTILLAAPNFVRGLELTGPAPMGLTTMGPIVHGTGMDASAAFAGLFAILSVAML